MSPSGVYDIDLVRCPRPRGGGRRRSIQAAYRCRACPASGGLSPSMSEAPELIVATIFAWRLHAADGLGMLLSAKVNQWTLLVGSLWVAYSLGGGGGAPLPLDDRQTEEFLLTSAQALLAFAVLADRRFGLWEAVAIFGLFVLQFPFPTCLLYTSPSPRDRTR